MPGWTWHLLPFCMHHRGDSRLSAGFHQLDRRRMGSSRKPEPADEPTTASGATIGALI